MKTLLCLVVAILSIVVALAVGCNKGTAPSTTSDQSTASTQYSEGQ